MGLITRDELADYLHQQYLIFNCLEHYLRMCFQKNSAYLDTIAKASQLKVDRDMVIGSDGGCGSIKIWPETQLLLDDLERSQSDRLRILAHAYVQYRALYNGGMLLQSKFSQVLQGSKLTAYSCKRPRDADKEFIALTEETISDDDKEQFLASVKHCYELTIRLHEHGMEVGSFSYACEKAAYLWSQVPRVSASAKVAAGVVVGCVIMHSSMSA